MEMNLNNKEIEIFNDFKNVFEKDEMESMFSDEDWNSMVIGFMIAKGIDPERAFELATKIEQIEITSKLIETGEHKEGFEFCKFNHVAILINEVLGVPWGKIDVPQIIDGCYTSSKDCYILQIFPDCWKLFIREFFIKQ